MIVLGCRKDDKLEIVQQYVATHGIAAVKVFSPAKFRFAISDSWEFIEYPQIIKYRWFYRLLQEINRDTLLVINECLRTQNRSDLTFNCLRHYLLQTEHQIVFQYLPQIDTFPDFMTLLDWDTRSRWKGQKFAASMLDGVELVVHRLPVKIDERQVPVTAKTSVEYRRMREKLFAEIGSKDPHTIPRNLYLVTGRDKVQAIDSSAAHVGRNNRFKLPHMASYDDTSFAEKSIVFELPHNVIDFADFLSLSCQTEVPILTTELKCDQWYFGRYRDWWRRIEDAYAALSR